MVSKRLLDAARRRRVPRQFSWVDQRLVREGHISRCTHGALALYLFLVTVCDAEGLSYYAERSLCERLNIGAEALREARNELLSAGLIAYEQPLYQVLGLDTPSPRPVEHRPCLRPHDGATEPAAIGTVLQRLMGGAR
jgi:hypothetical protein